MAMETARLVGHTGASSNVLKWLCSSIKLEEDGPLWMLKVFREPFFLVGSPVFVLGWVFDQPVLMGLGMSLLSCALISD